MYEKGGGDKVLRCSPEPSPLPRFATHRLSIRFSKWQHTVLMRGGTTVAVTNNIRYIFILTSEMEIKWIQLPFC